MILRFIGEKAPSLLRTGGTYRVTVRPYRNEGINMTAPIQKVYDTDAAFWAEWEKP
jgi:hypothetical protein